jgi:nicotinamidase-related amidase
MALFQRQPQAGSAILTARLSAAMTDALPEFSRAALLSMDLQSAVVSIYTQDQGDFLSRVAGVQAWARTRTIPILHVQVGFRPGLPEVGSRNSLFAAIKKSPQWQQLFQGPAGAIHAAVAPQGEEAVITKHRISAFVGTDLDMILRANEIDTLILMGIATSGVVLATLLDGSDADYRVLVVKDCCADQDPEVHACLTGKVFPRLARVVSAAELTGA